MDVQDGPSNRKPDNSANNPYASSIAISSTPVKNTAVQNTPPDPYQIAFVNAAFEPVKATSESLSDARPEQAEAVETRVAITEGNQLVRVQLFNLLIGDEKNAIYEKARLLGATSLPQKREWQRWSVGTGLSQGDKDRKSVV